MFDNGMMEMSLWRRTLRVWRRVSVRVFLCQHGVSVMKNPKPANFAGPLISAQDNQRWLLSQCPWLSIWLCLDTPCTQSKPYHSVHPAHCQFPDPSSSAGWSPPRARPNRRPGLQRREEKVKCWFTGCKHKTGDKKKEASVPEEEKKNKKQKPPSKNVRHGSFKLHASKPTTHS